MTDASDSAQSSPPPEVSREATSAAQGSAFSPAAPPETPPESGDAALGQPLVPILDEVDALLEGDLRSQERVDQALALVAARVRAYLDAVAVIVVALDPEGRILFVNRRGCELLGCDEDREILGHDWFETFIPERRRAETRAVLKALWAGDLVHAGTNENEIVTRVGEERIVAWTNEVLRDEDGTVWAVVGTGEDVTERRRAEHRLAHIGQAVEDARDGIGLLRPDGRILYMNPALQVLTGYTPDELDAAGGPLALLADPGIGRLALLETMQHGTWEGEVQIYDRGRETRTVILRTDLICDQRGRPLGIVGIHTDITERRRLEAEVLRATDEERQRIGRDLHDGLASHLVGLGMVVRGLARRLHKEQPALASELGEIAENVRAGAEQARVIARGLNPVSLDREGLRMALERLASTTDAHAGLRCMFEASENLPSLPPEVATQLYRIAQEAVTNALRHAEASQITIRLTAEQRGADASHAQAIALTVADDGRGLGDAPQGAGLGLQTMGYRARVIGATLDLSEGEGEGVAVKCRLPVR